jgi:endonuclease YncB( thermonuclease family)
MKKLFYLFLLVFLYPINSADTHSGRTNKDGCHNQRSNGTYHCHNKPKTYSKKRTASKAQLRVIDGDTIYMGEKKYRFSGIDTPEMKQTCKKDDQLIYCGKIAQRVLKEKIGTQEVKCIEEDKPDKYRRILAECFVGNESLSSYMVRSGYAFAYREYSSKFIEDENYAKENNLGLWKISFDYPWNYRKNNN